jgi:hypothetical protein
MLQISKWVMVYGLAGFLCLATPALAQTVERPDLQVGDQWSWQHTNAMVNEEDWTKIEDVVSVNDKEIRTRVRKKGTPGNVIATYTADLNPIDTGNERYQPNLTRFVFPFQPGKKWSGTFDKMLFASGKHGKFFVKGEITGPEKITVPAGDFNAYKIKLTYDATATDESAMEGKTVETYWYAPEVKNFVRLESSFTHDRQVRSQDVLELLDYSLR